MFHLGHAAHVAAGSVRDFHTLLGSGPLQAPHFPFFPWLAIPSSSERHTPTSATATVRVGHISFFLAQVIRRPAAAIALCRPRASSGLELDPFYPPKKKKNPNHATIDLATFKLHGQVHALSWIVPHPDLPLNGGRASPVWDGLEIKPHLGGHEVNT